MRSFIGGLKSPFSALAFIKVNPSLILYMLLPTMMSVLIMTGLYFCWVAVSEQIILYLGLDENAWYSILFDIILLLVFAIFMAYTFTIFGMIAATPFNDILSRKVLELRGFSNFTEMRLLQSIKNALIEVFKLTIIKIIIALLSLFIAPFLSPFFLVFFIGWDYFDYSLNHKVIGLKNKLRGISLHKPAFMGFALIYSAFFLIPFIGLLLMPLAVVSASLLIEENKLES